MWRVLGLTLVLVAAATTTANAETRYGISARTIETALDQSTATTGKAQRLPGAALQLQVGGALALTQPSLRASLAGHGSGADLTLQLFSGRGQADPTRPAVAVRWLDLRGANPALAYPLTDSLSRGLRYSYQRGEDLVFKVAKTGSLPDDYQSHKVLLRAQWVF
jgi:hypothetical protein